MLIALLAATVALADVAPAAAKPDASKDQKKEELVCHSEPLIGTNIKTKVCRTKAQIEADRTEQRQNLERMQSSQGPTMHGN